MAEINKEFEFR